MRLRQVALVAGALEPHARALADVFGLSVAHRDPAVAVFGLVNVVIPVGGEFLEIVQPVREDASAARYLARRGGDAGYMVILQADDALAHRARLQAMGVRTIWSHDGARYRFTHVHPADCAGVLLSIDDTPGSDWREPLGDWPPAGDDWRDHASDQALGITAVTIQAHDPAVAAARFSALLDRPASQGMSSPEVRLDAGVLRFVPAQDADGSGVVGLDIRVDDPAAALARGRATGLAAQDGAVHVCGTAFRPVA